MPPPRSDYRPLTPWAGPRCVVACVATSAAPCDGTSPLIQICYTQARPGCHSIGLSRSTGAAGRRPLTPAAAGIAAKREVTFAVIARQMIPLNVRSATEDYECRFGFKAGRFE